MTAPLPRLIHGAQPIDDYCASLAGAPVIALDTEFMRVNTYAPVLCLVQVFDGTEAVCLDALDIETLAPLMQAVERSGQPAVLHSARQDLETFMVTDGFLPAALFDTQVAAALTGPDDQLSYAQLVEDVTGVTLPKSQTRTNWAKRPLTEQQLRYAADDVVYLPDVQAKLNADLDRLGRRTWFDEDCARLLRPELYSPDIEKAWRRCKTRGPLDDQQRGALRALCAYRERVAIKRNRPRKWIIDDAGLEALATLRDVSPDPIRKILKEARAHRAVRIEDIIETIGGAQPVADDRPGRPSPAEVKMVKDVMAAVRALAEELGIAPGVLAARKDVERMVRGDRESGPMRGWRRDVVGCRLVEIIDAAA